MLDLPVETIVKAVRLDLAESALHAPQATWSGVEFYPSFPMKAAVLLVRLTKNHALPDGNKRTALATTIAFCDVNGFDWLPPAGDDPGGEGTYQTDARRCRSARRGSGGRRSRGCGLDR